MLSYSSFACLRHAFLFWSLAFQIVKYIRCICCQFPQSGAGEHFGAFTAGVVTFLQYTQAYFAQFAAIVGLAPFCTASHAVYPLGLELHLVHLSPFLRHFLTQTVVVVHSGNACLTFLAVETATSNQLFHVFPFL